MGVIDVRRDVNVDIANARAIGNILAAVGKAEQNRQKRYQYDKTYADIINGVTPDQAIANTQNRGPAPYDSGLAGVGQRFGRLLGGAPRDYTEDFKESLIMGKLKQSLQMQDPAYQADLEARRTQTAGAKQNQKQSAEMFPSQKTTAENQAAISTIQAAAAPTKAEQDLEANDLAIKAKRFQVENMPEDYQRQVIKESQDIIEQKNRMGYDDATAKRAGELHALMLKNEAEKDAKKVSDDLYTARKRAYELEAMEAENNYRKAMTQKALQGKPVSNALVQKSIEAVTNGGVITDNLAYHKDILNRAGYDIEEYEAAPASSKPEVKNWMGTVITPREDTPAKPGYRVVPKKESVTSAPASNQVVQTPSPVPSDPNTAQATQPQSPITVRPELHADLMAAADAIKSGKDEKAVYNKLIEVYNTPEDMAVIKKLFGVVE